MATADSISISDRMSSSNSLLLPQHSLKTTTVSTIAVQCLGSRMVIALLQSKGILNLRVLEMTPSLTSLGQDVEESERFLQEHKLVLEKLRNNQTPMEEFYRRTNSAAAVANSCRELSVAMGDSLGQAWRDLLANLELRKEVLNLGIKFHKQRIECLDSFKNDYSSSSESNVSEKHTNAVDAGRKLLEKLETIEDSAESVARVNRWLEELVSKFNEWKNVGRRESDERKFQQNFEELEAEMNSVIASPIMESKSQKLVALLSKINASPITPSNKSYLESKIYTLLEELRVREEGLNNLKEFLNNMRQLSARNFKETYLEKLRTARNLDHELTLIIQRRLNIREEYEEIFQNVLGYSDDEIVQKLSQDPDLDIRDALESIRAERIKQETDIYELFKDEIQNLEMSKDSALERTLSNTANLIAQLENAPYFQRKIELIRWCTSLHEEISEKIITLENTSKFLTTYRDITAETFMNEHNKIIQELERVSKEDTIFWKILQNRKSVRRSYEDILRNPTQFEEDEISELLTREDSLDATSAFKNIKDEKKLQELMQTLDFPLPENLETARNDLQDFKSFEEIIGAMPNATEELFQKTTMKKTKIMKCIEFYEMVESVERAKHIKNISRLEIELFGTTHISESVYEEKIALMDRLRQTEASHNQKIKKTDIHTTEAQTDDELYSYLPERMRTPPPLLTESVTQTKELEQIEVRHSETQTSKAISKFSATQTSIEQRIPAASMETQTHEIPPQIIYLTPEVTPVKLRNNQTQTSTEEPVETMLEKRRSQMLLEETLEEEYSRKVQQYQEKLETNTISTQTKPIALEPPPIDKDSILVKASDIASVAKLLRNTECQTETKPMVLDIVIPPEAPLPPLVPSAPLSGIQYSEIIHPATEPEAKPEIFQSAIVHESYLSNLSQATELRESTEETNIESHTPQMSVRERVKSWQITSPPVEHPPAKIVRKLSQPSQSITHYRHIFQSPIEDTAPVAKFVAAEEKQTVQESGPGEYVQTSTVSEYRKMFQSFQESQTLPDSSENRIFPKPEVKYWKPKIAEAVEFNRDRFSESAREKTLAMYRKLMQGNTNGSEKRQISSKEESYYRKRETSAPPPDSSYSIQQPMYATFGYKSPGFGRSEESIDGIYCSSSSERSGHAYKYSTLPIRPSKFIPKEFQESDYESDYDSKIPPIWVPPGKRVGGSVYYRPISMDYRSRSVPPSDFNGNVSSSFSTMNKFSTDSYRQGTAGFRAPPAGTFKPIPPPKPSSRRTTPSASPAFNLFEEVETIRREGTMKSEVMKREETKFVLVPPKSLQEQNKELAVIKRPVPATSPSYFVSVTSPPIVIPNEDAVVTTRSYQSREEFMQEKIETNFSGGGFEKFPERQKSPTTVTTIFKAKELMHPILYELDDSQMNSDDDGTRLQYEAENLTALPQIVLTDDTTRNDAQNSERYKYPEVKRFKPSKFIPMTASEDDYVSSAEEEFIVKPKWKPTVQKETPKFGPVKGPSQPEQQPIDPAAGVFYIACDFTLECGLVGNQKK